MVQCHPRKQSITTKPLPSLPAPSINEVKNQDPDERINHFRKSYALWQPKWLQVPALCAFGVPFLLLLVALALLSYFSRRNHGLAAQNSSNHYSWTFGPTAVMALITTFWLRVDHNCKLLAPWQHMQKSTGDAEATILLDYITPILPITLNSAIRRHDWAVVGSTLGVVLLSISIIASTGLFILTPTTIVDFSFPLLATSSFNVSATAPKITDDAVLKYYAAISRGVALPYGTTLDFAFDTLDLDSVPPNSTVTTYVDAFFPSLDCEIAETNTTLVYDPAAPGSNSSSSSLRMNLILSTSFCPTSNGSWQGTVCNPDQTTCLPRVVSAGTFLFESERIPGWKQENSTDDDPCGNLLSFSVIDFRYNFTTPGSEPAWTVQVANAAAVVCRPSYIFGNTSVTIDMALLNATSRRVSAVKQSSPDLPQLPSLSIYKMVQDLSSSLNAARNSITPPNRPENATTGQRFDLYATLMSAQHADSPLSSFLNTTTLQRSASAVFAGLTTQIISITTRQQNIHKITSTLTSTQSRLHLAPLPLNLLLATFSLLLLLILPTIIAFRPLNTVCRDPSSLASNAAILAASPGLRYLLKEFGRSDNRHLRQQLKGIKFKTALDAEKFVVVPYSDNGLLRPSREDIRWWRPAGVRWVVGGVAVVLPLVLVVVLEVLQRRSDEHDGIMSIHSESSTVRSLPSLISASIMLLVSILFDTINSAITILGPYHSLRGPTPTRGLPRSFAGHTPFRAFFEAARGHNLSILCSSTAAILSRILPILVSGLFVFNPSPSPSSPSPTTYHLTLSHPSKIALQTTLAALSLLTILLLTTSTPSLRHTLPHNPCTPAGAMSLLAALHDLLPREAQWMSENELHAALAGVEVSLGWWRREGDEASRFGVGEGHAEGVVWKEKQSKSTEGGGGFDWKWRLKWIRRRRKRRETFSSGAGGEMFLGSIQQPLERGSVELGV